MPDIADIIRKGEGKTLEFKETLPGGEILARTAVAFSNMAGGKIIIGIEDRSRKLIGVSENEALDFPDRIYGMIYDRCCPAIIPEIYLVSVKDRKILVVEIYPGALKPYYLKSKGRENGIYVRVGAVNKPADREMIGELERQKLNISFDEQPLYDKTEEHIDIERLKKDFQRLSGRELKPPDLLNLRIIREEGKQRFVTVGGMMLAGRETLFEYARVKCARFKGAEMVEFIDQKEFSGLLYEQAEEAMKFAMTYIAKSGKIEGLQRIDRYEVPLDAIREAIVNAIVHRDYSISGADIKFAVFDDRIEITSPGCLPRSLEIEDIMAGRSEIRNKVIARFFKEIGFIEQWGTGMRKMVNLCASANLPEPEFKESGLFFKIIFKKGPSLNDKARWSENKDAEDTRDKNNRLQETMGGQVGWSDKWSVRLSELPPRHREIIEMLRANRGISRQGMARSLAINPSAVQKHLAKLKDAGLIRRVGPDKGGYWQIIE
ncbi:MAG: helix-turn-helix domain-containing protein [Syntrophaceae bacterium]|nr:helix-turn-helix domain-containing protein [Pseudomonadota bacterium]MCG2740833.1 helix-turn-helix domain-containing protein [Syntrophaceae bacterium]